jgi:AcrR family transcriptional regulator
MKKIHVHYVKTVQLFQQVIDFSSHFTHNSGMEDQRLRRTPRQWRSQQRVEGILQAASDLLVEVGYEGLSTSAIAQRAGISVGSLYQFFANKEAVLQALAERYLEKMALLNETVFTPDAVYVPTEVLFGRTVDALVAFADRYKGFQQLFSTPWISPELQATADATTRQMIAEIQKIIMGQAPHLDAAEAQVAAQVLMHMVKGVLPLVEAADPAQRPAIVAEFKRMGVAYLAAFSGETRV